MVPERAQRHDKALLQGGTDIQQMPCPLSTSCAHVEAASYVG